MLIIGEKLNSSIPKTLTAMREGPPIWMSTPPCWRKRSFPPSGGWRLSSGGNRPAG